MQKFSSITIIYNPKSTGSSQALAQKLKFDLQQDGFSQEVKLTATKHAGHAAELAYKISKDSRRALIISASGDGGYSDVINGIMKARAEGSRAVAGILPAGNANDHYNNVQQNNIVNSITEQHIKTIDLLRLNASKEHQPFERYGHSYIGIGLTPKVGKRLNQTKLNKINEIIIALKTIGLLRPTTIVVNEIAQPVYSLVAANLRSMAKVVKLSQDASVTDGKFELVVFKASSKWKLLKTLLKSATVGLKSEHRLSQYSFKTTAPTLCQIDGEVYKLDANSTVDISLKHKTLECLF